MYRFYLNKKLLFEFLICDFLVKSRPLSFHLGVFVIGVGGHIALDRTSLFHVWVSGGNLKILNKQTHCLAIGSNPARPLASPAE